MLYIRRSIGRLVARTFLGMTTFLALPMIAGISFDLDSGW